MSTSYILINEDKKEKISFGNLRASTIKEILGNVETAPLVCLYFFENQGDRVSFLSEHDNESYFLKYKLKDIDLWEDKTLDYLNNLEKLEIIKRNGFHYKDDNDPNVYTMKYENIWIK